MTNEKMKPTKCPQCGAVRRAPYCLSCGYDPLMEFLEKKFEELEANYQKSKALP